MIRDWTPFRTAPPKAHADAPRAITSSLGIGDRLRAAAFAEFQAREAFNWAAGHFEDASESLRAAWRGLAIDEDRHFGWLLNRMKELNVEASERQVSDSLWHSLIACRSAREFAKYMASAEERGRKAGERFYHEMLEVDPISAKIFGKIAEEEIAHIQLASTYFPDA